MYLFCWKARSLPAQHQGLNCHTPWSLQPSFYCLQYLVTSIVELKLSFICSNFTCWEDSTYFTPMPKFVTHPRVSELCAKSNGSLAVIFLHFEHPQRHSNFNVQSTPDLCKSMVPQKLRWDEFWVIRKLPQICTFVILHTIMVHYFI